MLLALTRLLVPSSTKLLSVLLAVCVIVGAQSPRSLQPRRYKNLYGYDQFNSSMVENVLRTAEGALDFLRKNEIYLSEAQPDTTPRSNSFYDFIIVGAGTAGATIASRLTEIEDVEVLLIEAGPEETLFMDVPVTAGFLQPVDEINWKYKTEPSDKYCTGMKGRRCSWPRGKVMGGSSVLNYMIATRGSPKDFDRWAELGNEGWSYKDVLKYFKKSENIQIPELRNDTKYHGTDGPLSIEYPRYHTPVATAFLEAGRELGYPLTDYNGEKMIGFSYIQATTHKGFRMSSNRAFLAKRNRKNLRVTKRSTVRRILMDRKKKRAVGVELTKDDKLYSVYAKKEVILCAGAIGSPQLLMLSGVGPAEDLKELGIPVIRDAPVGRNLMDHIAYGGLTFMVDQPTSLLVFEIMDFSKPYAKDFLLEQKGPMTVPGGCDAIAFVDVDDTKNRDGVPNVELLFLGGTLFSEGVMYDNLGWNDEIRNANYHLQSKRTWGVFPMLLQPKSRGWIKLRSKDVNVKPIIVANYLDHPEDRRILIEGIRLSIRLSETKALRNFGSKLFDQKLPECDVFEKDSDDYWLCYLRMETMNIYHYSGTCKMGSRSDPSAVVDPTLKVIGVEGLRVADVSIMPEITSAHTNIPTFMIAEKLADMVKNEWNLTND